MSDTSKIKQLVETAKAFLLAMAAEADEDVINTGPPYYKGLAEKYGGILEHLAAAKS